jgi:hypothetical protein
MINLKPISLDKSLTVDIQYALFQGVSPSEDTVVAQFSGVYRIGCKGGPDAGYIEDVLRGVRIQYAPYRLIVDFSTLDYQWGDQMEWFIKPNCHGGPFTLVVGPLCVEALSTLYYGIRSTRKITEAPHVFDNLAEAWAFVQDDTLYKKEKQDTEERYAQFVAERKANNEQSLQEAVAQGNIDDVQNFLACGSVVYDVNAPIPLFIESSDYTFEVAPLNLPQTTKRLTWVEGLRKRMIDVLPRITFTAETRERGRQRRTSFPQRQFLVAPILMELVQGMEVEIRSEYPLSVGEDLRGTLDYLLLSPTGLLVIEAKQGDIARGFTQLAAEMIALDQWEQTSGPILYGAVSMGDTWRFGVLHRAEKRLVQDTHLYSLPDDLRPLCRILVGILS